MSQNLIGDGPGQIPPEDKEKVLRIAKEIIEPALQQALKTAKEDATAAEILSALANSYGGLIVDLLGRPAAVKFMEAHAAHLAMLEEKVVSDEKH